ncbi:type VI secretion system protein TssL, long form [Photobacterium lutimaris]|uniref:Type VI secretion system protein TssL n=1 Tax=Photobacterium lutimaris TaxID=388278 RepID=A0A2T3IZJ8_9GAMM|nr:type VI secretion system protein TssL, long form [Photobacterium lutimaris]PSU34129.1 type VI secretion system protein TssL [Photobacterium lutimaris]TDR75700.1 type VI secretion system protein ImpK [Photobacterium lutimaris]
MSEATLIKPRPGPRGKNGVGRNTAKQPSVQNVDQTVVMTKIKAGGASLRVPPLGDNPLVEEASTLLSLIGQIRSTSHHNDVSDLQQRCIDKVREYEVRLRSLSVDSEKIEAARYCLCSFLDETVLNTVWGGQSNWSTESLLSTFHSETFGGEYFYTLMESNLVDPRTKLQLLELQYICLSLGFVGKMRVEERGMDKLESYREQAYQVLLEQNGEPSRELSPDWANHVIKRTELKSGVPLWVFVSVFSLLTLAMYMGFSYQINDYSNKVFNQLNEIARFETNDRQRQNSSVNPASVRLQQLLQREIENGVLEIIELPDRVRIIMKSSELFLSGSAEVQTALMPVLSKVARALESTSGKILITGHTDNQPIFTSKYPSNWHLSLARATAVANSMAMGTDLHGRLWPEGLGESKPRNANDSEQERARNRRVEIDLLF